jgi:hypothetical protein
MIVSPSVQYSFKAAYFPTNVELQCLISWVNCFASLSANKKNTQNTDDEDEEDSINIKQISKDEYEKST